MNAIAQEVAAAPNQIEKALALTYNPVTKAISPAQTLKVSSYILNLTASGENALDQARNADINSEESFGLAGDLVKAINGKLTDAESERKVITKPMDDAKKGVMALFNAGIAKLTEAKEKLQTKQTEWAKAERLKKAAQAEIDRKAAEERALSLADAQLSMGDNAGADQVLTEAASTIDKMGDTKVSVRGMYGSSSGLRGRYVGTVDSNRAFLAWLLTQQYDLSAIVEFKQSGLNGLAKEFGEKGVKGAIPGMKVENVESTVSR
jgi:hypothetical protein